MRDEVRGSYSTGEECAIVQLSWTDWHETTHDTDQMLCFFALPQHLIGCSSPLRHSEYGKSELKF